MNHAVRRATAADAELLARLDHAHLVPRWSADALREEIRRPASLVLVALSEADLVIGFLVARFAGDEAEILRLAVDPPFRRRGLAAGLVRTALEALRGSGIERCHLELHADNGGALAFYRSLGFREQGSRPRYYPDGGSALLMERVGL